MYFNAVEFGERLQEVRRDRGFTQEQLADRLRLASKYHLSRIERGEKSCSIDMLVELSGILHVSTDYLLTGKEPGGEHIKEDILSVITRLTAISDSI